MDDELIAWAPTANVQASAVWVKAGERVTTEDYLGALVGRVWPLLDQGGEEAQELIRLYLPDVIDPVNPMELIELMAQAGFINTSNLPMTADKQDWEALKLLKAEEKEPPLDALDRFLSHSAMMI